MVYERMIESVRARGGEVHLKTPVLRVEAGPGKERANIVVDGRGTESFDYVVSSMPLTLLVERLPDVPDAVVRASRQLRFRNTILVYLHVDSPNLFPDQWLYVHSADIAMGRVTNFRNWVPELYGHTQTPILALEYWCNDDDSTWSLDDAALIDRAKREIARTGLLGTARTLEGRVIRVPRCYPVYRRGYRDVVATLSDYLRGIDRLIPIGRYGAFKYNNQDHSILMGLLAAENVTRGAKHDLWAVNTDYESYQEAAVIDETGLVASPA